MWKADEHKVWAPVSSSWLGAVWRPSRLLAPPWPHAAVCRVFWQSSWGISHLWCLARVCGLGKQNFTRVVYKGGAGFFSPFIGCSILPSLSSLCSVSVCWNVGHTQGSSLLSLISTSALTHPDIPEQRFRVISEHGSIISLLDTCALIFYSFQLSLSQV